MELEVEAINLDVVPVSQQLAEPIQRWEAQSIILSFAKVFGLSQSFNQLGQRSFGLDQLIALLSAKKVSRGDAG